MRFFRIPEVYTSSGSSCLTSDFVCEGKTAGALCWPARYCVKVMNEVIFFLYFLQWRNSPMLTKAASFFRFLNQTQWHTAVGRTPLNEGSAPHREIFPTTRNTHRRQAFIPPAGSKPAMPASVRQHTLALARSATGIGEVVVPLLALFYSTSWAETVSLLFFSYRRENCTAFPVYSKYQLVSDD